MDIRVDGSAYPSLDNMASTVEIKGGGLAVFCMGTVGADKKTVLVVAEGCKGKWGVEAGGKVRGLIRALLEEEGR